MSNLIAFFKKKYKSITSGTIIAKLDKCEHSHITSKELEVFSGLQPSSDQPNLNIKS